MFKNTSIADLY